MSEDPRPRPDSSHSDHVEPKDYEPPRAEDMPDDYPVATAAGAAGSPPITASDRALKHQFADVDIEALLAGVLSLAITSWSYKGDDPTVRHIGPMAQDFAAAFGVGEDDRHIHAVDADGIAFAAIQALGARLGDAERQIATLETELERVRTPAAV